MYPGIKYTEYMSREHILEAFILKKQDFGETDQIITIFSKQEGKLRCMVKAAKLPTSKLQPALQPLFRTQITLASASSLPKVIRTQTLNTYSKLYADPEKLQLWFVVAEFLTKAVGDGAPNEQLYDEISTYLHFLQHTDMDEQQLQFSILQFQLKALAVIGLGLRIEQLQSGEAVWFSQQHGGLTNHGTGADSAQLTQLQYELLTQLVTGEYAVRVVSLEDQQRLAQIIISFITYQLERELKSQRFFTGKS